MLVMPTSCEDNFRKNGTEDMPAFTWDHEPVKCVDASRGMNLVMYIYIYMYIYIVHVCVSIYIYMYIKMEREIWRIVHK